MLHLKCDVKKPLNHTLNQYNRANKINYFWGHSKDGGFVGLYLVFRGSRAPVRRRWGLESGGPEGLGNLPTPRDFRSREAH